jgi:RHS repeat-associated protein
MNGSTLQKGFVPLPGGGTAVYNGIGVAYYRHSDWLGSSRFATTTSPPTSTYADAEYAPYGEPYGASGTLEYNFTGQNQDTVSSSSAGLYDFLFREYSPVQGRWISPDPAGLMSTNAESPQSWNRYAFVRNNPLSNIDPEGLDCVYLNDAGNGVESIDHNSNANECTGGDNGGYWVPGTVPNSSWITSIDSNTGAIGAYSEVNGFFEFTASTNNFYGVDYTSVGVNVPTTDIVGNVYTSADDLSPSAQRSIIAIAKAAPTICGGGVYYYAGREVSAGTVHGFVGGINEFDSVGGKSSGTLVELGGGEGVTAGGGFITTAQGNGPLTSEGLLFGGAGVNSPVASTSVGIVGFQSGAGVYAEGFLFGKGGGGGAYLNVTTNGGCPNHR